ncbi:MAG: hypothetical protein ABL984_16050 [Pyrinomonadaceae bacterium]
MKKILLTILLLASVSFGQTITVNTASSFQTWKGWEVTAQGAHEYLVPAYTFEYPSTSYAIYDGDLFTATQDLGLDRWRVEWNFRDWNATAYDPDNGNVATQPSTNPSHFRNDRVRRAMDSIILPYESATGTTQRVVICLVDFDDAGYDAENTPSEYAAVVLAIVNDFFSAYGRRPYAIEAILEPDGGENTTNWTAAKLADNIVAANTALTGAGHTGIKWIAPSTTIGANANVWYEAMIAHNASVQALLDEITYHLYVPLDNDGRNILRDNLEADGKSAAMTEWIAATHLTLYDDLIHARVSSWQQYVWAFPNSGWPGGGDVYFDINTTTWAVTLAPRTRYLRHYMKYVRTGAVRKGVTNSSGNFLGVPFQNANGSVVVPVNALTSGTVNVTGLPNGTYGRCVTIGDGTSAPSSFNSCASDVVVTSASDNVALTFSGAGVGTVFDVNFSQSAGAVKGQASGTVRLSGGARFN